MNSVNLIGSLTEAPRLDSTASGQDRCAMRLAVRRRRPGGRREPGVVHVDVRVFGAQARRCAERLSEGGRIGVSGLVEVDEWRDEDGTWRTRQDVVADAVDFLDPAPEPRAAEGAAEPRRRRRGRPRKDERAE